MNFTHQLAMESLAQGHSVSLDVAINLIGEGYDVANLSVDGFDVIDIPEVDYFDYIDQNH